MLTILRFAPTIYVETVLDDPMITDDMGNLVKTNYGMVALFLNNEFKNIPAALEYYGCAPDTLPRLI